MINRRTFLKNAGAFAALGFLAPSCLQEQEKETDIRFEGEIRGEKNSFGHKMRDKLIDFSNAAIEEDIYDVVIAGGGLSGLVTAYKLKKAGVEKVLVLEKEDVAGGLCRGEEENGLSYSCGAHYTDFPDPANTYLNEIYEDCGIITGYDRHGWPVVEDEFLLKENGYNLFVDGKWENSDYPFSIANSNDLKELERFENEMENISQWRDAKGKPAIGLPLSIISEEAWVRQLDEISFGEYLRKKNYKTELLFWYCNIWIIDEYGVGIDDVSAWAGLQFFRHKILPEGKEVHTVTFPQGLGYVSQKLVGMLSEKSLRLNQWVVNMHQSEKKVITTVWDEKSERFYKVKSKKAVFALPKTQVYHIIPQLRQEGRTEFEGHSYVPWLVATVHLKKLPDYRGSNIRWDNTIFDSWTMGYVNNHHQLEKKPQADQAHVISLYACFSSDVATNRALLLGLGWEHWAKVVVGELKKAHPDIDELITKLDCWIWGHPMRQPVVGAVWGQKRADMHRPFGNLHFGHVDVCGLPIAEEAIARAGEIADLLLTELMIKGR